MPLKLGLVPSNWWVQRHYSSKNLYIDRLQLPLCYAQSYAIHFIWITHQNTRVSCLSNMYFVSHVFCMHSPSILCVLLCVHNSYAVCVCIRSFVYCLTILNMLARSNYTPFISFHPVMFFVFQLKCLYIWSALKQPPYFA